MRKWLLVATAAGALSSCGGSSQSDSCASGTSQSGAYTVTACANGAPARGVDTFVFTVADANGVPQPGLNFTVEPWMPDMNHGSPGMPSISDLGGGKYQVSNVVFTMPGVWQLRTTFSSPSGE